MKTAIDMKHHYSWLVLYYKLLHMQEAKALAIYDITLITY